MRLRSSLRWALLLMLLWALPGILPPAAPFDACAVAAPELHRAPAVQPADVDAAIARLRADPNLAASRKTRIPRWRSTPDEGERRNWRWLNAIVDLFRWLAQVSRVFVWVVIGLLVGALALYLVRLLKVASPPKDAHADAPPTHVRDLDIRPESLPNDLGAAAWALWERGEQRSALALLYRGLLSRMAHAYAAPIRASSTEGDCLCLARSRLPVQPGEFAVRLINVWERAVYGGKNPEERCVRTLCDEFALLLVLPGAGE